MTQTHTPGPWLVREHSTKYPDLKGYTLSAPRGYQEPGTGEFRTCGVICGTIDNLPDARLIAAAPDMLAALQAIAALPDNQSGDRGPIKHARHIAKCAIAKATS